MIDAFLHLLAFITLRQALWGVGLFVATFVISLLVVGYIVVKMPATFFLDGHSRDWWGDRSPWLRWSGRIAKNVLGLALVVLGGVQLFAPGQGVLTILIGVVLLDFPGKRKLERKLIGQPKVLAGVNRLRARYGQPPLVLDASTAFGHDAKADKTGSGP